MQHLVLTKLATGCPSQEWLLDRLLIFERYCSRSLHQQTNANYTWLLAVARDTPTWFTQRANRAAPHAVIVRCATSGIWVEWSSLVKPFVNSMPLLTTRLDSDDLLHMSFIEQVQRQAAICSENAVIDFPRGYKLRLTDLAIVEVLARQPSPFLSLVEFDGEMRTAYRSSHVSMGELYPVRQISTEPFWIQVCHNSNLLNRFSRNARVHRASPFSLRQFLGRQL